MRILAPHKEQDGWVYVRVARGLVAGLQPLRLLLKPGSFGGVLAPWDNRAVGYDDGAPGSRVISSRRVEEAVETADFLRLCAEEGIPVHPHTDGTWTLGLPLWRSPDHHDRHPWATGNTLREAYYRYKAVAR